jgi:prolycopene isomerase
MEYDVLVIGAGLSGLAAASLLAKRDLSVLVVEHADRPGGSCGAFRRQGAFFDQGASMLYGFGERGFNAHRFLFNALEEPFAAVRHDLLYTVRYHGKLIRFWPDIGRFVEELSAAFPDEGPNIARFYRDMERLYDDVIAETPSYTTPDETNPREALRGLLRHPFSYLRFLTYLNCSAEKLLKSYFRDPELLHFFDKLTSTYCYATLREAPAVLAGVMFIDNHVGGSWYPAGSTLLLAGTLEKAIEEHGGVMRCGCTADEILFEHGKPCGVRSESGEILRAKQLVYSGTVWNLYGKLLRGQALTKRENALSHQSPRSRALFCTRL